MFVPAGYRPAEAFVRAGVGRRREAALARGDVRPVPVVRFYRNVVCLSRAHHAFLSECRVFVRAHHAFLSECPVFVRAHHAFLSECPVFDHACCLPHSAKQNGLRNVAFLFRRGSRSPVARSRIVDMVIELCRFTSGLYVSLWRSRRRDVENGVGGTRGARFCAGALALICFPRGERWGLRAPKPAPRSH